MHNFNVAITDRGYMFRLPHIIIIRLYTWSVKKNNYCTSLVYKISALQMLLHIYKDICLLLIEKSFKYKILLKKV
jgi:hypothetical protein